MASLPYPRSQNNTPTEFTEFTEQTDKEYSPTDFTDLHRYLLPQISQIYTDIYSHGIHGAQNRLAENILPQISQIYTDIYFHRIHGTHRTDWQRIFSHRFHRFTQIFTPTEFTEHTEQTGREYSHTDFTDLHRYLLPQNSRNSQNRLAENILPHISQIYTDIYFHRIHGIHRTFCLHLCKSVKSVGVSFQ